jgi:hypothetical protein
MLDDETRLHFPGSGFVDLPLIFEPQLLRCTAAGPGGDALTVLLDTGTDPSAIDLGLARRWGLRIGDFGLGRDATSDIVPFTETVVPWLRLGDLHLRHLFALALDLSVAPFKVDVVLGYNVLRQVVLHVDYMQRFLRLSHPDLGIDTASPSSEVFSLSFFEHFPALTDVRLSDHTHLPLVTIDTGSNGGLTVGPDVAAWLGLNQPQPTEVGEMAHGAGFSSQECALICGQVPVLHVGSFALPNVDLDTPGNGRGDLQRHGRVNMGNRILARFASMTLDYGRAICVFRQYNMPFK